MAETRPASQPAIYARHRPSPALQSALLLLYNGRPAHSYSVLLLISIYNLPLLPRELHCKNHTQKKGKSSKSHKGKNRPGRPSPNAIIPQRKYIYISNQPSSYPTLHSVPSPPLPPSLRPTKSTSPSLPPFEIPPSRYSAPPPPTTPTT